LSPPQILHGKSEISDQVSMVCREEMAVLGTSLLVHLLFVLKTAVEPLLVLDLLESTNTCSCWGTNSVHCGAAVSAFITMDLTAPKWHLRLFLGLFAPFGPLRDQRREGGFFGMSGRVCRARNHAPRARGRGISGFCALNGKRGGERVFSENSDGSSSYRRGMSNLSSGNRMRRFSSAGS
jgi:hypothetical protein